MTTFGSKNDTSIIPEFEPVVVLKIVNILHKYKETHHLKHKVSQKRI